LLGVNKGLFFVDTFRTAKETYVYSRERSGEGTSIEWRKPYCW